MTEPEREALRLRIMGLDLRSGHLATVLDQLVTDAEGSVGDELDEIAATVGDMGADVRVIQQDLLDVLRRSSGA